ncbi:MAG TPA: chemotaxis protein CheW [Verrucomicrobiae bacterium]|nr:chemotaxis protein CheW [Verrucomicrobiae bacterium]
MLCLLFELGESRYALDALRVMEVLPLLTLKPLPQSPPGFAGVFNYRGRPVPAIDLCQVTLGVSARNWLSTRIIVIAMRDSQGQNRPLGLIAERVTQVVRKDSTAFQDAGLKLARAPYLGPICMDATGTIQLIQEEHLLNDQLRTAVFEPAEATAP